MSCLKKSKKFDGFLKKLKVTTAKYFITLILFVFMSL